MSGCVNAWQAIPTSTSAKRLDTPKIVVGRSPRQVDGRTFSERSGVPEAAAMAVDFVFIRRRVALKIMLVVFAMPSTAAHIEGAIV